MKPARHTHSTPRRAQRLHQRLSNSAREPKRLVRRAPGRHARLPRPLQRERRGHVGHHHRHRPGSPAARTRRAAPAGCVPLPETSTPSRAARAHGPMTAVASPWRASIRPTSPGRHPARFSSASAAGTSAVRHHRDDPQPHVEGGVHLLARHVAQPLRSVEDRRPLPRCARRAPRASRPAGTRGRLPGMPAAGDVGEALHLHRLHQRQHVLHVDARRLEQRLAQRPSSPRAPRPASAARLRAGPCARASSRWSAARWRPAR